MVGSKFEVKMLHLVCFREEQNRSQSNSESHGIYFLPSPQCESFGFSNLPLRPLTRYLRIFRTRERLHVVQFMNCEVSRRVALCELRHWRAQLVPLRSTIAWNLMQRIKVLFPIPGFKVSFVQRFHFDRKDGVRWHCILKLE